jgi:hypothetical protein
MPARCQLTVLRPARVIDVLDHVLDKGTVIDASVRVSLVGIDLLSIEARVVVASFERYLNYAGSLSELAARPAIPSRMLKDHLACSDD